MKPFFSLFSFLVTVEGRRPVEDSNTLFFVCRFALEWFNGQGCFSLSQNDRLGMSEILRLKWKDFQSSPSKVAMSW